MSPRTTPGPATPRVRLERLARLERLQSLTEALSGATTREEVARIVFEHGLGVADAKAVTIFSERRPGELELVQGIGVSEEFASGYRRVFADEPLPGAEAYRTGEPVWLSSPEDIAARFPTLVPLAKREGVGAWVAIPLTLSGWKGAVGLHYSEPRALDEEERAFVLAMVVQSARAIERARLFDAHKRLAERLQQLQLTAGTLSAAATPRDVAAAAFRALGAVGACAAEIHALEGPEDVVLLARHGRASAVGAEPSRLDAPEPAAEVIRSGRALWLDSPDEIDQRYPLLAAERARREERAWAVVPLLASGRAVGALTVAFAEPRRLEADERNFVRLVAQPCAAAIERARLFDDAARSRAEAESASAVLAALVSAAPAALLLVGEDGRIVRMNPAFVRLAGIPPEAHEGRRLADVLPGVTGEQVAAAVKAARETGRPEARDVVGETLAAPGRTRHLAAVAFPVRVEGKFAGFGLFLRER
ncbi:MAG TPA: GAF domain-containing protein [Anaeromyxobacter sp.]|nr:GAF domain-containing protein [Anaeromyxobacter sp.]